jgi:hypothetical protein
MNDLRNHHSDSAVSSPRPRFLILVGLCLCLLLTLGLGACSSNFAASADSLAQPGTHTSAATTYPIKVYFSRYPESVSTNYAAVYPVNRTSPTVAVGTFAIQMLIAGPTPSEKQAGYFSELNTMLSGTSNCSAPIPVGGPDFTLTLNMKGKTPESGTATLQLCRTITSPGIGADARVTAEINATLKQFSSIKKVVILTKDGHCFGDASGKDLCLK